MHGPQEPSPSRSPRARGPRGRGREVRTRRASGRVGLVHGGPPPSSPGAPRSLARPPPGARSAQHAAAPSRGHRTEAVLRLTGGARAAWRRVPSLSADGASGPPVTRSQAPRRTAVCFPFGSALSRSPSFSPHSPQVSASGRRVWKTVQRRPSAPPLGPDAVGGTRELAFLRGLQVTRLLVWSPRGTRGPGTWSWPYLSPLAGFLTLKGAVSTLS